MRLSSRLFLKLVPVFFLLAVMAPPAQATRIQAFTWANCFKPLAKVFAGSLQDPQSPRVRSYSDLEKALSPYFLMGKPQGWEEQLKKASSSVYLSGNGGGAERVTLPDGSRLIVKTFPLDRQKLDEAQQIVNQMKTWENTGEGVPLRGVSTSFNPRTKQTSLKIFMEDLEAPQNSVGTTRVSGNGTELTQLRPYSHESKKWMVGRLLEVLDKHPDPHPKNVQYRVSKLSSFGKLPPAGSYYQEGDLIFQVILIDVTGGEAMGDHPKRSGKPDYVPSLLLQYNRQWQKNFFNKQLGLSPDQ